MLPMPNGGGIAVAVDPDELLRRAGDWETAAGELRIAATRLDRLVADAGDLPADVATRAGAALAAAASALRTVSGGLFDVARDATARSVVARGADDPTGPMLALDFAPKVWLAHGERYHFADPRDWLHHATFHPARSGVDPRTGRRWTVPGHYDMDDRYRSGDDRDAKLLYRWDPGSNTMTYYLFYAYDDGASFQNHEGDWERVTVQLDDRYHPVAVRYSAHGHHTNERPWNEVEKTPDGRPVVYSALGSHANAPHAGRWHSDAPCLDDRADAGNSVDLARQPVVDVTKEPYYGKDYDWGRLGEFKMTSGPTGPGPTAKGPILPGDAEYRDEAQPCLPPLIPPVRLPWG
jgi:hypothetical protein